MPLISAGFSWYTKRVKAESKPTCQEETCQEETFPLLEGELLFTRKLFSFMTTLYFFIIFFSSIQDQILYQNSKNLFSQVGNNLVREELGLNEMIQYQNRM